MNRKLLSSLLVVTIISISIPPAFADSISYTEDIRCIPPVGDEIQAGCDGPVLNPADVAGNILMPLAMAPTQETLTTGFVTPLDPAQPTVPLDVTFTFLRDTGTFVFSFGFCFVSDVTANPITQPQLFAEQCLGSAIEIFDDSASTPGTDSGDTPPFTAAQLLSGDSFTINDLAPGLPVHFYLLPNNNLAHFVANSGDYFPAQTDDNALRVPLFALDLANPGEFDQMLGFTGDCEIDADPDPETCTIFMFEDLSRADMVPPGASDEDFTDIAFIVDAVFPPIDFCTLFPDEPVCIIIGGEFSQVDTTALLVAGATSTTAFYMYAFSILGIGALWFSLNPFNRRNVKAILSGYLDRFSKSD